MMLVSSSHDSLSVLALYILIMIPAGQINQSAYLPTYQSVQFPAAKHEVLLRKWHSEM